MDYYPVQNYNNVKNNKDNIDETKSNKCYKTIYMISHVIISFFAIYLSWRCHNGFNLLSFLVAIFCPYLYIIWALATRGGCGIFDPEMIVQPVRPIPAYTPLN